jgi:hypothetical protein
MGVRWPLLQSGILLEHPGFPGSPGTEQAAERALNVHRLGQAGISTCHAPLCVTVDGCLFC